MIRTTGLFAVLLAVAAPAFAAEKNLVETIAASKDHQTLYTAIKAAGLGDALKGEGPFTVLAPTDDAFSKLPAGTLETLLKPENKEKLVAILTYHVIPAKALAADVVKLDGKTAKTLNGESVPIKVSGKTVTVGKAKVTAPDLAASNGVIHVIDAVLLPPAK